MRSTDHRSLIVRNAGGDAPQLYVDPSFAPQPMSPQPEGGATLLDVLIQRRWIIVSVFAAAVTLGGIYLMRTPAQYQSTARLVVEQTGPKLLSDAQGVMVESDTFLYAQCERILSTPNLTDAVNRIRREADVAMLQGQAPVLVLKDTVSATVGAQDGIISVSFSGPVPSEAPIIVNAVVQAYIDTYSRDKLSNASDVAQILTREKEKREAERTAQTQALLKFKQANGELALADAQGNIVTQKLVAISSMLTAAELATIDARVTANALNTWAASSKDGLAKAPSALVLDRETQALVTELNNAQLRLSVRGAGLAADHPSIRGERKLIDDLRTRILSAGNQAQAQAEAKEKELRAAFLEQREAALALNSADAEKSRLENDLRRTERLCELLDDRIKELTVVQQAAGLDISILENAELPLWASEPKPARVLGIAVLIGLVAGVGAALVRDRTDQRLCTASDVVQTIGLPILGVVPRIPAGRERRSYLAAFAQPMSTAAEAYRSVRTALRFGMPGMVPKTILVTSPSAGEGKSTAASNLAISLAMAGHSTCLVEADMRKPVLKDVFADGRGSINRLLRGEITVEEAVSETDIDNLRVLTCDSPIPRAAEIIAGPQFKQVLAALEATYDYVVIDSPPACAVSDARVLATMCDVTLVVVRAHRTSRRLALRAVGDLFSVGARVLGVIVNNVSRGAERSFNEYGSYYYAHPQSVMDPAARQTVTVSRATLLPAAR